MWTVLPLKVNDELRAMTNSCDSFDRARDDVFRDAVGEIFLLGVAAHVGERQHGDRRLDGQRGRRVVVGLTSIGGPASDLGRQPDLQRIDADRLGDVLELRRTEIADRQIEPSLNLPEGLLRQADRAGLGDALQPRGDVDAVAHQVAVALLDHIAKMNADAELDASLRREAGVALDHAVLHFDRATHGVDHTAKLDESAVAGAFDDAAVMHGDGRDRSDRCAAPAAVQRAILVCAGRAG